MADKSKKRASERELAEERSAPKKAKIEPPKKETQAKPSETATQKDDNNLSKISLIF
jgi:hypothetical protein